MPNESFLRGRQTTTPPTGKGVGVPAGAAPDATLSVIAGRQHGVVSMGQLLALGLSTSAVSKRLARGRLHRVFRGVYAVGHRALSQEGRWMAAVLAAGKGAVLSHLSAAVLFRIWRRRAGEPHVVAPRRLRAQPGVTFHEARRLDPRDITTYRGIPVTTVPRTLIDLTDLLTPHQLANVIHEAAFRNRFRERAVRAAMERAPGRRNLDRLEAALELNAAGSAGTRSDLEDRRLSEVRAEGFPEPLVNTKVRAGGREIEVDLRWPAYNLIVEIDGPAHARPRTILDDLARVRDLIGAGHRVLRLTEGDRVERLRGAFHG